MSKKTKAERGISGSLKIYFCWPLILSTVLILMNIGVYMVDMQSGILVSAFVVFYVIVACVIFLFRNAAVQRQLVKYAVGFNKSQKKMLKELNLPYAMLDYEGRLIWSNDAFLDIIHDEKIAKRSITNVFPAVTKDRFPSAEADEIIHTEFEERNYRIVLRRAMDEDAIEKQGNSGASSLIGMYMYDETEITTLYRENQEQQMILGLLYIDNYEEALDTIDEVRRALLAALIDRKINKYMQTIDAIIRKLEKDKYIVIFKSKYLPQLQMNRLKTSKTEPSKASQRMMTMRTIITVLPSGSST